MKFKESKFFRGTVSKLSEGEYGFINEKSLPHETFTYSDTVSKNIDWAVTSDYNHMADNHCAAVFVTNLCIYFASKGYENLLINKDKHETFNEIHKIVGNGPVAAVAAKAATYFRMKGYGLRYRRIKSFTDIKKSISQGHPLGMLLAGRVLSWHWVMGIGWRQYSPTGNFVRIIDSWNNTSQRFYKPNEQSLMWSVTEYWIE